jgi:hypothetical protein
MTTFNIDNFPNHLQPLPGGENLSKLNIQNTQPQPLPGGEQEPLELNIQNLKLKTQNS